MPPAPFLDEGEPSLLLSILRRRKRFIFITTAVTVLATVAIAMQEREIYSSTSAVVVQAPPSRSASAGPNMATEAQIGNSLAVARGVDRDLRLHVPPSQLLSQLSVHVPADSEILKFTYSSPRPKDAQALAQAFAQAYATFRRRQFENEVLASATSTAERVHSMTTQLSTLRRQVPQATGGRKAVLRVQRDALTAEIALLQQKLSDLNGAATSFSPAAVLGSAPLPRSPARPKIPLNAFIALLGGLLLGFGIAALAEYVDNRVRGATDLHARLGVPVLGLIPRIGHEGNGVLPTLVAIDAPASRGADAFRRLRANFVAAATDAGARSVAITSIDHQDSPIDFAGNLAAVLAATGKHVVLLSTSQRQPTLEELLGARAGPGFFDALAGTVPVGQALSDTGIDNLLLCGRGSTDAGEIGIARAPEYGRSRAAAVASVPPAQSLGSDRAAQLIGDLAASADFVLVDAPPLLADADAAALAGACDGVLAVARLTTTRADVARAREQFERVRARVLGSVLIDPNKRQEKARRLKPAESSIAARQETEQQRRVPLTDDRQSITWRRDSVSAAMGEKREA